MIDLGHTCETLATSGPSWRCPRCGDTDVVVLDKRNSPDFARRRKRCNGCLLRFTTHERIAYIGEWDGELVEAGSVPS